MNEVILNVIHLIGSAMPLAVLCLMLAILKGGKKVKTKTVASYVLVAVLMFIILLRT